MLLAVDMGNTNIVIGCVEEGKIIFYERMGTDQSKTSFEYAMGIKTVLDLHNITPEQIEGSIISSVVPNLTNVIRDAIKKLIAKEVMIVGPGTKTGVNILLDNPKAVGADLVVGAVAGIAEYGAPLIIIDMGTATTFSVIDKESNYIGGMIIPGLRVSMDSLVNRTAQLPKISLEAPKKSIGKNTVDCMKSGIMFGQAAMIDGLIDRVEAELGYEAKTIATGGLAGTVAHICSHDIVIDDDLLLKGLEIIYNKNK